MDPLTQLDAGWYRWLEHAGWPEAKLLPLAGDVSTRLYFRVTSPAGKAILAVYPDDLRAACRRFLATSRLLGEAGVPVPEVLASGCDVGLMLVEDVGERTVWEHRELGWPILARAFEAAGDLAARIAGLSPEVVSGLSPALDRSLMERELEQTLRTYLRPHGWLEGRAQATRIETGLRELCERVAHQPLAVCHRDFMVRNLVPVGEPLAQTFGRSLIVLDHQDLRCGPATYDLASLLNDSLFPPAAVEAQLLEKHLPQAGLEDYHAAAAQRALKAIGTYASFAARGHDRHVPLIRPTMEQAIRHLSTLPEAGDLAEVLRSGFERIC